ncbi:hypothetical protein RJ639_014983 [Escallonia herrerae]|uniref:Apple domain-containing protein n=1 Tax=Escallonia herrerae TaxID=1293975 RepID=A0AA88VK46_9ASTE|nr:hypothetical protein RJ639_014983 [Escallonia herrerae]
MDPRGRQTYLLKQQNPYWRSNVYAANLSSTIYNKSQGFASSITYVEDGDEVYTSYSVSQSWVALRFKIVPSGQYMLQLWQQSSSTWQVLREVPHVGCDFYGHCGPYGSCDQSGSVSLCNCLTGFEPKIQTDWITGNWTSGCVRKKALSCNSGDGFLKLPRMKLPDHSWSLGNKTASECEFQCRGNCSCTAYACLNVSGEFAVNCLLWFGDLIDLVNNHETGQDLYVHLHGSELGGNGESKKTTKNRRSLIAVAVATISIGVLLISIFGYMLRRKRLRKPELRITDNKMKTGGYMSPEYALYGRFSEKSDVFSFGVLLLEIVSSKRNTDFYHMEQFLTLFGWAWENWKDGRASDLIDISIRETCKHHEVIKCINVALLCVQEFPADRPTISDVVLMLANGSTALIPSPKEPAYSTLKSPTTTAVRQLLPSLQTPSSYSKNGLTISNLQPR